MLIETLQSLITDQKFNEMVHHKVIIFKADQKILSQDQEHSSIYLIQEGRVRVVMNKALTDHTLRPGIADLGINEILGELSLFDDLPASADVVALQECKLLEIDIPSFQAFLKKNPKIGYQVYHDILLALVKRLRQSDKAILHLYEWGMRAHKLDKHFEEERVETPNRMSP